MTIRRSVAPSHAPATQWLPAAPLQMLSGRIAHIPTPCGMYAASIRCGRPFRLAVSHAVSPSRPVKRAISSSITRVLAPSALLAFTKSVWLLGSTANRIHPLESCARSQPRRSAPLPLTMPWLSVASLPCVPHREWHETRPLPWSVTCQCHRCWPEARVCCCSPPARAAIGYLPSTSSRPSRAVFPPRQLSPSPAHPEGGHHPRGGGFDSPGTAP